MLFTLFIVSKKSPLDEAQALLDDGMPHEAATILEPALKSAPRDPFLLLYSGLANVERGETAPGLLQIEEALKLSPGNPLLRVFYARALYDSGAVEGVLEQCAEVEKSQPNHPGAATLRSLCETRLNPLNGLGRLAVESMADDPHLQGRALYVAEEALKEVETPGVIAAWPDGKLPWKLHQPQGSPKNSNKNKPPKLWLKKCKRMQMAGAPDAAIVAAERAMQLQPSDEILEELATLYFESGRYAETEAALRNALQDNPARDAYLGVSLFHIGQIEEAAKVLQHAEPDAAHAAHILGRALLLLDKKSTALGCFVRTARLDSTIPINRIARAYLYLSQKNVPVSAGIDKPTEIEVDDTPVDENLAETMDVEQRDE